MMRYGERMYRDIPGYESLYQVGECGCVLSKKTGKLRRWKLSRSGKLRYAGIYLYKRGKRKFFLIHRLVLLTYVGASPREVHHKDFNSLNNCLSNLDYVTHIENIQHSIKGGRYPRLVTKLYCRLPYLRPNPVFTYKEIDLIKSSPLTNQELADLLNVPPSKIKNIK